MQTEKIIISPSPTADTRTCNVDHVSSDELLRSTAMHIDDVRKGICFIASLLADRAMDHDKTKISDFDQFYHDFKTGFQDTTWWLMHKEQERHHLSFPNVDKDCDGINLIDILECVVDGVMAGIARSGKYYPITISSERLQLAVQNTAKLLLENIELRSGEEHGT